jgi:hypothetical protein
VRIKWDETQYFFLPGLGLFRRMVYMLGNGSPETVLSDYGIYGMYIHTYAI